MSIRIFLFFSSTCFFMLRIVESRTGFGSGEQEWDYATVRPGAHMFWWLYYTTNQEVESFHEKPLIIWLQGGPGSSSTGIGNFEEIGPLDTKLELRNSTWVKNYNVLFIDNPVGSGFSYVDNDEVYATTNSQIAADLLEMMRSFYKKLPKFRHVPVYIVSESYGGKYAVEFALLWYKAEKSKSIESNLKGVALGDASISPIDSVLTWGPYLLQMGFVDTEEYRKIQEAAFQIKKDADAGHWVNAAEHWKQTQFLVKNVTKDVNFYNVLLEIRAQEVIIAKARKFVTLISLMNKKVKKALDITEIWQYSNSMVFEKLENDFMKPVIHIVERLLDETDLKVFVYNGQLDLIVDSPGQLQWVEKMKWNYAEQWRASPRVTLVVNGTIEGYSKTYRNFAFYWVNRAGHMVPIDNPGAMDTILKEITVQ